MTEHPRRAGGRVVLAAALLVALAAVAAAGYLFQTRHRTDDGRASALAAARQYAVDLTTYDFASVDSDFARAARHGTKQFKASYAAFAVKAKPGIVKAQRRALGTVVGAGLESYGKGRASVLVAVDQSVHSATKPGEEIERSRIRITLVRAGSSWLVSGLKVL